jgi:hypothetical protein
MSSLFTDSNPNIIDQLSGYSPETLDKYIQSIKYQIDEQQQLNKLLKKENYEETIEDIKTFIERNKSNINHQLEDLKGKIQELKEIVNENHKLEQNENRYETLLDSDEYQEVADNLLNIKKLKEDVTHFLSDQGIILPRF